jgi:hypothetical protein
MRPSPMLVILVSATASLTTAFPLLAGYGARLAAGSTDNYTISRTCNGTATFTNGAATTAAFEGVSGFAVAQTVTRNFTTAHRPRMLFLEPATTTEVIRRSGRPFQVWSTASS